jgi:hypothetical protein
MSIRRRIILLGIATVLLAVIAGGIIRMSQKRELPRQFVLPDGNRVTLVDVMVGTNSSINFGTPVERVLAHLPGKLGKKFKKNTLEVAEHFGPGNNLTLLFSFERAPANPFSIDVRVAAGTNRSDGPRFRSGVRVLPNGKTVACSGVPYWPRREKMLTVRLTAMRTNEEYHAMGEITVANPAYGKYPLWQPERLPVTRRFEEVTFVLDRVSQGDVRIRVGAGEKPETGWELWNYEVRDATGNRFPGYWNSAPIVPVKVDKFGIARLPIIMHPGMPPEKAWKLGIQFVCTGKIASNQVFVVRGVPVTAAATTWPPPTWTTNLPCGTVRFRQQPDWRGGRVNTWYLSVVEPEAINYEKPLRNPPCIVILGAVNDQGQRGEMVDSKQVQIPSGSTTLDVTIAVVRQHFVEYAIDPEMLQ